jgi:hypothetical protein
MKPFYLLACLLSTFYFSAFPPLHAQDTLSFGGIYELPGAEVRATYNPVSPLAQSFTIEEIYRLPGTFYDPARLVALLPGVVQTNDQANHLSVRGNTPNANLWRLNGLAIVNPNHTANAGTFYDFPTLSGGGVNAISAQMLDNSGFLAGGLPVEYGFATGGTFDLRLRPGSKTKQKYQAQAGFIGFDLMAEGPIGNSGKTSYLVNGRYSFTGLLADMGVDFGGEEIRFADLNGHLHHQWDGGEISAFAIVGASSNVFTGPDSTEQEITEQKELFDIDFESDVQVYGVNAVQQRGRNTFVGGVAYSRTSTERLQDQRNGFQSKVIHFRLRSNQVNANFRWERKLTENSHFEVGTEFLGIFTSPDISFFINSPLTGFNDTESLAPFVNYSFHKSKVAIDLGGRVSNYFSLNDNKSYLEPRISLDYQWNRQQLGITVEAVSRPLTIAGSLEFLPIQESVLTQQVGVSYSRKIGGVNFKTTGYYQSTPDDIGFIETQDGFINGSNNIFEYDFNIRNMVETSSRRYGVEIELAGGRKATGWYYRGSLSLLRAETQQFDGSWTKDRYSNDFIGKLTLGREWQKVDKKQRETFLGLNLALITHGGERYGQIVANTPGWAVPEYFSTPLLTDGFLNTAGTYFRPDLRLYKTKIRPKTTTTLALDVQNVAGIENLGNVYYDAFLERPEERLQLGVIPVLSYRITWR